MKLTDVAKTIMENENDFIGNDGMYDGEFIKERFNLSRDQYWKVMDMLWPV